MTVRKSEMESALTNDASTYQSQRLSINSRVCVRKLSGEIGREATLADILDDDLDILVRHQINWIYLLEERIQYPDTSYNR